MARATKLAVFASATLLVTGVVSVGFTWWSSTGDRLGGRLSPGVFSQRGLVPIGYALLALAVGVALGAVIDRTLPAMAGMIVLLVGVRAAVSTWVRPNLVDPVVLRYPTFTFFGDDPSAMRDAERGWVLATQTVDRAGTVVSSGRVIRDDAAARLCGLSADNPTKEQLDACGETLGLHNVVVVIPADRFWDLQLWETTVIVAAPQPSLCSHCGGFAPASVEVQHARASPGPSHTPPTMGSRRASHRCEAVPPRSRYGSLADRPA